MQPFRRWQRRHPQAFLGLKLHVNVSAREVDHPHLVRRVARALACARLAAPCLGKQVVAEGVETADQLSRLRAMGCGQAQGFHLSAPLSAAAAQALVAEGALRQHGRDRELVAA